jgi:hypothetical protein
MLIRLGSPDDAFILVLRLCGVSLSIGTLELLARRELFNSNGCLSWRLLREFNAVANPRCLKRLFTASGVRSVLIVRLAAAVGLLLFAGGWELSACLVTLALSSLLLNFRMPVGRDGSDQMNALIVIPASVAVLCPWESAKSVALFFIAAQASLAYTTSGIAKLISPVWRSGEAIPQILSTLSYGHPLASRALGSMRALSLALCWSVILFETLFPLSLLLGLRGTLAILTLGLLFHASCAVLMGLNCFFWSFLATYPAIVLTSTYVRPLVHLR